MMHTSGSGGSRGGSASSNSASELRLIASPQMMRYWSWSPWRRQIFDNVLRMLAWERPQQWRIYTQTVLFPRLVPAASEDTLYQLIAKELGTTDDNVRVARMRACRYVREEAGDWVERLEGPK